MDAANNIMDQLRQQGWKPPHEREPGETGPWDDDEAVGRRQDVVTRQGVGYLRAATEQ